jgi:hypothetical protein
MLLPYATPAPCSCTNPQFHIWFSSQHLWSGIQPATRGLPLCIEPVRSTVGCGCKSACSCTSLLAVIPALQCRHRPFQTQTTVIESVASVHMTTKGTTLLGGASRAPAFRLLFGIPPLGTVQAPDDSHHPALGMSLLLPCLLRRVWSIMRSNHQRASVTGT